MTLGEKIKAARMARGLTQQGLVGDYITRNMLSKIEHDAATPSVGTLTYLAKALDLPTDYFLDDRGPANRSVPDGLDEARFAYRSANWAECLALLSHNPTAAATDEGYLLCTLAGLQQAEAALEKGDLAEATEWSICALDSNRAGIYASADLEYRIAAVYAKALQRKGETLTVKQRETLTALLDGLPK